MPDIPFSCPEGPPERADKVLATAFHGSSRAQIQRAMEAGRIRREDGSGLAPKSRLFPGDRLLVDLSHPQVKPLRPVPIPLKILFEDPDLLVVDKAAGMVVHPGDGTREDTLVHALLHHCGGEVCPVGAPDRPGIVHRLDKDTSGVMVVAKSERAHRSLVDQFSERKPGKVYLALVAGHPKKKKGEIALPIGRHPKVRVKMAVAEKGGKPAHTDWELLTRFREGFALVECSIRTGRTHQIRVHMSSLNHPLAGDATYGYKPSKNDGFSFPRVMLHAKNLRILHPATEEELSFEAPLPKDYEVVLDGLNPL
ncbi:MAG TPA: RluA family pseudouridine synthase, partial [Opitutae bacterium]|nr:RluA family pseudouridine synthase [Opitutae bacterium]|tara:strand:- start:4463 stop:5392 length:930 start_codon:yes stop_codon:yes gene_type:complete